MVHLILAEGGNNCEIVRHLTKDCKPSKENDHPVMPQKAAFKELLLSKNHSLQALEETIDQTVITHRDLFFFRLQLRVYFIRSKNYI